MSMFECSVLGIDPASCAFLVARIATISSVEVCTGVVPWLLEGSDATLRTCAFLLLPLRVQGPK